MALTKGSRRVCPVRPVVWLMFGLAVFLPAWMSMLSAKPIFRGSKERAPYNGQLASKPGRQVFLLSKDWEYLEKNVKAVPDRLGWFMGSAQWIFQDFKGEYIIVQE